jgi:hypothetical protein
MMTRQANGDATPTTANSAIPRTRFLANFRVADEAETMLFSKQEGVSEYLSFHQQRLGSIGFFPVEHGLFPCS